MQRLKWIALAVGLLAMAGCGFSPEDPTSGYARVLVRNASSEEIVRFDVSSGEEVLLSAVLEPMSTDSVRVTPNSSYDVTATVLDAEGADSESFSESVTLSIFSSVTFKSGGEDEERGLSVYVTPIPEVPADDDGE